MGCVSTPNENIKSKTESITEEEKKQFFAENLFGIECPCELGKEFENKEDNYTAYRCNSTDKNTIYAISVTDLSENFRQVKDESVREQFMINFFEKYEQDLQAAQVDYQKINFYGFDAIEYSVPISSVMNKQIIFAASNLIYTLSVTSQNNIVDSLFYTFVNSFELFYKSPKYSYSIEIPKGFISKDYIGKNVDFKYFDAKGNSIVIVVKRLLPKEEGLNIDDLLEIPNSDWEANLQMTNLVVKKKGIVYLDNQKGMFLHYTAKDDTKNYTIYYTNYFFIYNKHMYVLTAACEDTDLVEMGATFFRALQSFKFSDS